jgi:hypothetical protein
VLRKECRSSEVFAVLSSFSCIVVLTLLHLQMCATPCVARCQGSGHICLGRGVVITCTLVGSTGEKTRRPSMWRFECLIRGGDVGGVWRTYSVVSFFAVLQALWFCRLCCFAGFVVLDTRASDVDWVESSYIMLSKLIESLTGQKC